MHVHRCCALALLLWYFIDRKLHINDPSIYEEYKLHRDSEQCATVGVLRELLNCRDSINIIGYFNYDEVTRN